MAPNLPIGDTGDLLTANEGLKALIAGEHLVALYGVTIDSDASLSAKALSDRFLFGDGQSIPPQANALGVDGVTLVYDSEVDTGDGKFTVVTYTQQIEGLPAHGTYVKIPVLLGTPKKISYIGMRLMYLPENALPSTNEISAQDAIDIVDESATYGHLTSFSTPEKVVYQAADETQHRAWRFSGSGNFESYRFFVDTTSEEIVGVEDRVYHSDVSGSITGWATPGTDPDSPSNPPEEVALPGVEVYVVEGESCPPSPWANEPDAYTDGDGEYGPISTALPALVGSRLVGEWVNVIDCEGEVTCAEETRTQCDVATSPFTPPLDLTYNAAQTELGTAAVNGFLGIEGTHDWFAALQPYFTAIDTPVDCRVNSVNNNVPDGCNAGYLPDSSPPSIECLRHAPSEPETCRNFAYSTVISHEYGHFILDRLIEADYRFHEGIADAISTFMWDTECMASDYRKTGECNRNMDAVDRDYLCFNGRPGCGCYEGDPECDPEDYECANDTEVGCEVQLNDARCLYGSGENLHCYGMAIAGAFWDLRELLLDGGDDWMAEELLSNFLFMTMGHLDESVLIEVLVADDDDGNLTNGTPNGQDILCAFVGANADDCSLPSAFTSGFSCSEIGHGWACPLIGDGGDGSVQVDWDGPSGTPASPDHFSVNYDVNPPVVTLKATEGNSVQVTKWYVGRIDQTTGETLDLGAVYTEWDDDDYDIEVQKGTTVDQPCRSINIVEIEAQNMGVTYSNIVFGLGSDAGLPAGSLYGRAQCYAGTSGGGLISGTIEGVASRVLAAGVGEGEDDPGQLAVGFLFNSELEAIAAGSTISTYSIWSFLEIAEEMAGTIDINGRLEAKLRIEGTGESTGDILIDGDVAYDANEAYGIYIAGDMSGDILVAGDILGTVQIDGIFDGDICARNVRPGVSFPANIQIAEFGSSASVCGWPGECTQNSDCDDGSSCTEDCCDGIWCEYTDNDTCTGSNVCPPTIPRPPHSATKNRYVSFNPTNKDYVAFEIELTDLELTSCSESGAPCRPDRYVCSGDHDEECDPQEYPDPCSSGTCTVAEDCGACSETTIKSCILDSDCGGTETCEITNPTQTCVNDQAESVGTSWWVGQPLDPSCKNLDDGTSIPGAQCLGVDYVSRVVSSPYYSSNWPETVHVGDCEIVPAATYRVRATDGTYYSDWLDVDTTPRPGSNYWADGVGPLYAALEWQRPDGTINFNEITAQVHAFQKSGAYPHVTWVDVHGGEYDGMPPNFVVNFSDIQFALGAFAGLTYPFTQPADCPGSPSDITPGGSAVEITVVPRSEIVESGEDVVVDVFMDSAESLGAYQVTLEVTGGTSGELMLTGIDVDTGDDDYVFKGVSPTTGIAPDDGQAGGALSLGDDVAVSSTGYLGTYTYQQAGGALGEFTISIVEDPSQTFLNDASGARLAISYGNAAVVGYGIDCYNDTHCDDDNPCTTDTCTSNECGYANVAASTACDDGLWCTAGGSTCDGNGNCTGGNPRCDPGEICDEQGHFCIGEQ